MTKNKMVVIGGFVIALGILMLLMAATPGSTGVELKLKELVENQDEYLDNYVTVEGLLIEDTIKWNADKIELRFDVQDNEGNVLHIIHNGVKPDNFTEGVITIAQGYPSKDTPNQFEAEKVQTRCPSKYEGQDMENYDPEAHKSKLDSGATKSDTTESIEDTLKQD